MIDEILRWAKDEKHIQAVILTGSRATNKHDELSDYDLVLLCTDIDSFTCNDVWLSKIRKVWVCVHEKICIQEKEFPSRLVIFEKGIKVDFSFYPVKVLKDIANVLFQSDYKISRKIFNYVVKILDAQEFCDRWQNQDTKKNRPDSGESENKLEII